MDFDELTRRIGIGLLLVVGVGAALFILGGVAHVWIAVFK